MKKIKVLIADDHAIVREGLKLLLDSDPDIEVVGEAEDGKIAIKKVKDLNPDMVIMDVSMPILNGMESTRLLKKEFPKINIIILSMYPDEEYIRSAIEVGANGYVLKKSASKEIFTAIHEINKGRTFFSPIVSPSVLDGYRKLAESHGKKKGKRKQVLTVREREVLQLVAEGHSTPEISKLLFIEERTVANHRQHIMNKLDIHDVAGLTRYAINRGIIKDY